MNSVKILAFCVLIGSVLFSCELLGGGKNKKGGEVVWRVENKEILTVSTQPAIDGDRVYFIQDARLKAYRLAGGELLWSRQICSAGLTCDYSRTIAQSKDRLFIDQGYDIQAHAKTDGSVLWETTITDNAREVSGIGSPVLSQDDTYLYAGRKGYVVRVRKSDGQIAGRYPLDRLVPEGVSQGATEPIISPYGDNMLYVPTNYYNEKAENPVPKGNVFSFDGNSREIQWAYQIENYYHYYTLQDGRKDSLLIRSSVFDAEITKQYIVFLAGSSVVVLDRFTGKKVWERVFNDEQQDGFDVGMVVKDGGIYIASAGFHATKLDLQTGEIQWRRDITFSNTSIPTVQNGRLYFNNSGGGGIWVLDTNDGSVIYNEAPPNHKNDSFDVYISSLGVGEGYMVNVGSKAVYCLRVP